MASSGTDEYSLGHTGQWLSEYYGRPALYNGSPARIDHGNQDAVEGGYWSSGTHCDGSAQDALPELIDPLVPFAPGISTY